MLTREKIVGGALAVLPLIIFPGFGDEIRVPKAVGFLLFAGIVFSYFLFKKLGPEFGAFFAYVTVNSVFTGFNHSHQMLEWLYIGSALGVGTLVSGLSADRIRTVLFCILAGVLINAAYAYVQLSGKDFIFLYRSADQMRTPTGFLGQQTLLGPFLACGIVIALFLRKWVAAAFILPIFLFTGSSFTYAGLAAGLLVYGLYAFPWKHVGAAALTSAVALYHLAQEGGQWLNDQGRFEIWRITGAQVFRDSPFFGRGFGTFKHHIAGIQPELSMKMNGVYREAHSDAVQLFHDGGLVGVLLVLVILALFVRRGYEYFHLPEIGAACATAAVIITNSLGNFPMRLVPQGLLPILCVIMVTTFRRDKHDFLDLHG